MKDNLLITDFLAHLRQRGVRSAKSYRYPTQCFLNWITARRLTIEQVTPPVTHRYLVWRKSLGRDPQTHFYRLRLFFRWLVQQGMIPQDPTQGVFCSWVGIRGGYPGYQGDLRGLFDNPRGIVTYQRLMFWPDLERYIARLLSLGYSRRHLHGVLNSSRGFHHYLVRQGVKTLLGITPVHVDAYRRYRRRQQGVSTKTARDSKGYVENFLRFAFRQRGHPFRPPAPQPECPVLPERLLERYLDFCRMHKGHTASTARDHREELHRLARYLDQCDRRHIQDVTLSDLEAYCIERDKKRLIRMKTASILRSFWRYLHLQGILKRDLSLHIQSPCRFQADRRPKYLPWPRIVQLLDSIDRKQVTGKRDYAILSLLACHGLRAREASKLCINDIDWQDNSFVLRERKNGDTMRLPLSVRAKEALKDYLAVRPASPSPEIFMTVHAPIKPLGRALYQVALRQMQRHLGRVIPHQGAYVLRHSFAKALLDRGAALADIGALLGHRSLHGTSAYLRINTEDLREVGDNYANGLGERPPDA